MKKFKIGVIRVLTTEDPKILELHGALLEKYYPQFETISRCIPNQPTGVHDDETERIAIPKVIALGREMAPKVDAIIISCAGDPGLKGLSEAVNIPVIGAGEATAFLATKYGEIFGVLGITDEPPAAYKKYFKNIVGIHRPTTVHNTLDLMKEEGRKAVFETAISIKEAGAQVIAISCTGIGPLEICGEIEAHCGIPVIDPIMAEGLAAYYECLRRAAIKTAI